MKINKAIATPAVDKSGFFVKYPTKRMLLYLMIKYKSIKSDIKIIQKYWFPKKSKEDFLDPKFFEFFGFRKLSFMISSVQQVLYTFSYPESYKSLKINYHNFNYE